MKQKSKVMTLANRYVKLGMSRSMAMIKAWVLVKAEKLATRIAGTSFNRRQDTLEAMLNKPAIVKIKHESDNIHDKNAISVWVYLEGQKGYYRIGYLPKAVAFVLAPILDKGESLRLDGVTITGGFTQGMNFGAKLELAI